MTEERRSTRSLERGPGLREAAVLEREIAASLERVWENVHDWEHLPWLHAQAFESIECLDRGEWGWLARVGIRGGAAATIELVVDPSAGCYVARTLEGAGAPTEIWTRLRARAADRTAIRVGFWLRTDSAATARQLGEGYVALYERLWDEDEEMMQGRERALQRAARREGAARAGAGSLRTVLDLGAEAEVRASLPRTVELGGERFRIVELDGALVAHATECPHRLGPLDACDPSAGELVCPWHGYRFDPRSGRSTDGRGLRLRAAPRVRIQGDPPRVRVEAGEQAG